MVKTDLVNKKAFTKEDFEFVKKSMIEAVSIDENGNRIFNPEKYNSMCKLIYSEDGKPVDMAITIKRKVDGKVIEESILSSKYDVKELAKLIAESAELGDYSLYEDKEDLMIVDTPNYSNMKKIDSSDAEGYSTSKELKFKTNKKEFVFQYKSNAVNK